MYNNSVGVYSIRNGIGIGDGKRYKDSKGNEYTEEDMIFKKNPWYLKERMSTGKDMELGENMMNSASAHL